MDSTRLCFSLFLPCWRWTAPGQKSISGGRGDEAPRCWNGIRQRRTTKWREGGREGWEEEEEERCRIASFFIHLSAFHHSPPSVCPSLSGFSSSISFSLSRRCFFVFLCFGFNEPPPPPRLTTASFLLCCLFLALIHFLSVLHSFIRPFIPSRSPGSHRLFLLHLCLLILHISLGHVCSRSPSSSPFVFPSSACF